MATKRWFIVWLTLFNVSVICCVGQNSSMPDTLHKVQAKDLIVSALALARRDRAPAGVVVARENYCAKVPDLADSFADSTVKNAFEKIATATGGSVTSDGRVLVLHVGTPPKRLSNALNFKLRRFPQADGTLPYLGALLDGWMLNTLPENRGFAIDVGSSPGEENLHFPETFNISVQEVADQMVSLGKGGVWIATDTNVASADSARNMSIDLYSYADTEVTAHMQCPYNMPKSDSAPPIKK